MVNAKITTSVLCSSSAKRAQKACSVRQSENQYDITVSPLGRCRRLIHLFSVLQQINQLQQLPRCCNDRLLFPKLMLMRPVIGLKRRIASLTSVKMPIKRRWASFLKLTVSIWGLFVLPFLAIGEFEIRKGRGLLFAALQCFDVGFQFVLLVQNCQKQDADIGEDAKNATEAERSVTVHKTHAGAFTGCGNFAGL